ncbi:MAG TPA: hypothetical protein VHZ95_04635, partial [Polyangiales bacterium]|nr:hypothetical protein [Polyangiales bacterium]
MPSRVWIFALCELTALVLSARYTPRASADTVLSFKYTPAPRVQVAIWIEDAAGHYLRAVAITEAVAYRGIGNRPGASEMNSGYRWPYGRREGVLPIWAHRRASAAGAKLFPRVIFQNRVEGLASRTTTDQSPDGYYCLQFDMGKSSKDDLDAVSCATMFSSDKGRYLTAADVSHGYSEPWEVATPAADGGTSVMGIEQPLPLGSMYPPRMDAMHCTTDGGCYDGADVDHYAADARAVMPEIDAITVATPPGGSSQDVLFTVPKSWANGDYVAFIEVNLEGDYNDRWNATDFPTPTTPMDDWDQYAELYGYPYRGQPSLVWKLPFSLGAGAATSVSTTDPVGRSSWNFWAASYGQLETLSTDASDPQFISSSSNDSGVDRLREDSSGKRFAIEARSVVVPPPTAADAGTSAKDAATPALDGGVATDEDAGTTDAAVSDAGEPPAASSSVGPIENLTLSVDPDRLRSHT